MLVRDALAAFVAGFNTVTPDAPIIWVHLGWLRVPVPNPGHLEAHDLHHIVLGAGPDVAGEVQVGVFELRTGCATWSIFFLDLLALIVGLLWRPRDVLRWWKQYAGWRTLYRRPDLKAMLDWELAELRAFAAQRSCQ